MHQTRTRRELEILTIVAGGWVLVVLSTLLSYGVGVLLVQHGQPMALGLAAGLLAGGLVLLGTPWLLAFLSPPTRSASPRNHCTRPQIAPVGSSPATQIENPHEAAESTLPDQARAKEYFKLGNPLAGGGDADGVAAAYGRAKASGHTDVAPLAAYRLGALLEEEGDVAGAAAAYARAEASGYAEDAPEAARTQEGPDV